jgi:hypothetical protein
MQRRLPNRREKPLSLSGDSAQLAVQITHLLALDVPTLREKWTALLGAKPSPHFGRVLMVKAIAYRLQERALGGLKPSTQRVLDRIGVAHSEAALLSRAFPGTTCCNSTPSSPIKRCAIYTRKSSEEGLGQDFNSLRAQREACEAFIKNQAGEG